MFALSQEKYYDLKLLLFMLVCFMFHLLIYIIMITEIYCVSGTSGVEDDHVFISSGENVSLSCNKALSDCKSTTWTYYNRFRHSAEVELITGGIKNKDSERHERLSLESDCSLNIKNVTGEDYGLYRCRQYGPDAYVLLHVLHGKFMIMWSI